MENKDRYFVAVKAFITDTAGRLLITKDRFGDWDIPGGRLRDEDFEADLESVLERKIGEELGPDFRCSLRQPAVFMRHERQEIMPDGSRESRRIFAIGYEAAYEGGDIRLGGNHELFEWVPLESFRPEEKFRGGWLAGIKEFQAKYKSRQ